MNMPQYVTPEEVQRVCKELGIRDWTALAEPVVQSEEAEKILAQVNVKAMPVTVENFRQGLEVELEHGTRFDDANVTNNHPILTGMIVMAHLKETLDYYQRIDVAEVEGDILKALVAGDVQKAKAKYKKLLVVRRALCEAEAEQLP
ncbi:MAG: hypothetical protein JXQ73_29485 [Phycisphaerae bacterium]|nr:hypothetical protein [Phycisphaerae bacterium]